jgi:hypothetical protein
MTDTASPEMSTEEAFYGKQEPVQPEAEPEIEPTADDVAETAGTADNSDDSEPAETEQGQEIDSSEVDAEESTGNDEETEGESEEEETLYLDLDGEQLSLDDIRTMKKQQMLEQDYTQKRQVDSKREKDNLAKEAELTTKSTALEAALSSAELLIATLQSDGYLSDDEITKSKGEVDAIRAQIAEAAETSKLAKAQAEQVKLFEANPGWIDNEGQVTDQYNTDVKLINGYFGKAGFTNEEVAGILNHKVLMAIQKAAKYDALQKKTAELKKQVKKVPLQTKPKAQPKTAAPKTAEQLFYGK